MRVLRRLLPLGVSVVAAWLLAVTVARSLGGGGFGAAPAGPAVGASACFSATSARSGAVCRSPDGAWMASITNSSGCHIHLTRVSTTRRVQIFRSGDACAEVVWAKPHQLLFRTENNDFYTVSPAARYPLTRPAAFAEFVVSRDSRWVAGDDATGAPEAPQTAVYLLTPDASTCLMVPLGPHRTDQVVGFTRDSKALIVSSAPWNGTSAPPAGDTTLRQFRLSSLHTVCDGSELVG